MANAQVFQELEMQAQYERDGLSRVIPLLKTAIGGTFEKTSDGLVLTRSNVTALAAGSETAAWTNAAVRLYAVHIAMPSTSTSTAIVQFFNTSSASATLGTTPRLAISVQSGKSRTVVFMPGNDDGDFGAAMSYGVSNATTYSTASNATNAPVVTILSNK